MNNNSLISIIIPTYNRSHTLIPSVDSVLHQTYKNIELIIIDDCSTDDTESVVKSIGDSRIIYFKLNKNSGACVARNKGIELAKGEYIAFNDSDDIWLPEKLEKQLKFLDEQKADVTTCMMNVYDENNQLMYIFPESKQIKNEQLSQDSLLEYNCTSTQLLFGKAECFKNNPFDSSMPRFQDWEECLRLSEKYNFVFQNEILVNTFQQKDSITKNPQKGLTGMQILHKKYSIKINENKNIANSFYRKMASFSCRCGKNPVFETKQLLKFYPNICNMFLYLLAITGIYKILFRIKNHIN